MSEDDPLARFAREYARAMASEEFDGSRCAVATADAEGRPAVRFVLLHVEPRLHAGLHELE